jgi:uncharacterized membrane protein
MGQVIVAALLWFSAVGCGLMAGVYFAFSTFIMPAFGRIEAAHAISAMNSINTTILKSLFMPLFFGTTLAALALVVAGFMRWGEPGGTAMLAGGILYVVGMFVFTVVFNVPLNDALAAVNPASREAATLWARYLPEWTFWNHVRTVASLAASVLFIAAIAAE